MRALSALSAVTTAMLLGGCAVLAGYDFGDYEPTGGSGGSTTTGTQSGPGGGGATSTSSTQSTGGSGGGGANAGGNGGGGSGTGAGGSGGSGPLTLFSDADNVPTSLVIDATTVYFTTAPTQTGGDPSIPTGVLRRVDKDGTHAKAFSQKLFNPFSVVVDATHVYWAASRATSMTTTASTIDRTTKAFGALDSLTSANDLLGGITVVEGKLFWTLVDDEQVWSSASSGASPAKLETTTTSPNAIASDADGIYWLGDGDIALSNSEVLRANLNGTDEKQIAAGQDRLLAIAIDATRVYWSTLHGGLASTLKDGTGTVFFNQQASGGAPIGSMVIDAGTIYYTQNNFVMSVAILDTNPVPVITESITDLPIYLAIDATSFYYSVSGAPNLVVKSPR